MRKGPAAAERAKAEVKRRRQDRARRQRWMREVPRRLVLLDKTSVGTGPARLRGRRPRGGRLCGAALFGRPRGQTFVAGRTCDELIAPWISPGAMEDDAFDTCVETRLAPVLVPGAVVVLDNLSTHRSPPAAASPRQRGCRLLFVPPHSPDPNPIEMAFAKPKAHLRRHQARRSSASSRPWAASAIHSRPQSARTPPEPQAMRQTKRKPL